LATTFREFQNDTGTTVDQQTGADEREHRGSVRRGLVGFPEIQGFHGHGENVENRLQFDREERQVFYGLDLRRNSRTAVKHVSYTLAGGLVVPVVSKTATETGIDSAVGRFRARCSVLVGFVGKTQNETR